MLEDVAYQIRTPEFWNACVGVCDESDYRLGGSFFDGKGQPRPGLGGLARLEHGALQRHQRHQHRPQARLTGRRPDQ